MKFTKMIGVGRVFSLPTTAYAQQPDRSGPSSDDGWAVAVGGGGLLSPKYLGADEYHLSLLPSIRITKGDKFVASVQEGISYALIESGNFRAGPLVRLEFGRDEDGSAPFRISGEGTDDLIGLGDVDTSVSLGGFAELSGDTLSLQAKVGQAVNGHDGLTGELGIRYKGKVTGYGPPLIYSLGPNVKFGDDTYTNAFFGVNTAQAAASGLPEYEANDGVVSYGVSASAILPLSDDITANFILGYDRLTGDVADAPLVSLRGSPDQIIAGAFLSYTF